jgi:hypothetical protein
MDDGPPLGMSDKFVIDRAAEIGLRRRHKVRMGEILIER